MLRSQSIPPASKTTQNAAADILTMIVNLKQIKPHPSTLFKSAHAARSCCRFRSYRPGSRKAQPACSAGVTDVAGKPLENRRQTLNKAAAVLLILAAQRVESAGAEVEYVPATIQPNLAPKQGTFDPTDEDLRDAAALLQRALNAEEVQRHLASQQEEALLTELITKYESNKSNWVPDVVGRAYGNRGNARSRQGKLEESFADYNTAIRICPWSGDPVLNRGVILEALGQFEDALTDYRAVLAVQPQDPAGWNNLGNASAGLGRWKDAKEFYGKAASLAPEFAFSVANKAVAMFQLGETNESMREMRALLRRYPDFPDMRAALAAADWSIGKLGDAESNYQRLNDPRYRDRDWLKVNRRWPPKLLSAWEAFLDIKKVAVP
ncbi:TPA: hypothetical protein ACH3X2_009418 [Trebouxia sp. C0005]